MRYYSFLLLNVDKKKIFFYENVNYCEASIDRIILIIFVTFLMGPTQFYF